MSVIPLILAGHFEDVGKTFQEAIQPDFDVVYFVTSPQAGLADIPVVLKGEIPTSATATGGHKVGSGNLAHGTPRAVIVSGSYDDAFIERLRKEIAAVGKAVPILKLDHSGAPAGAAAGAKPTAEKTKAVAERAVKVLKKLEDEGKLDGDDDGVYSY